MIIGFDADPSVIAEIKGGLVQGTIAQQPFKMGEIGVQVADLVLMGKHITYDDWTKKEILMEVYLIDENGEVIISDPEKNTKLYKNLVKGRSTSKLPLFEILGSDEVILVIQSRGNIGAIWAKIIIDNKRKEILIPSKPPDTTTSKFYFPLQF